MGRYIEENLLDNDERIIQEAKTSQAAYISTVLAAIFPVIILALLGFGIGVLIASYLILAPLFCSIINLRLRTTELAFTEKKVLGRNGIFKTTEMSVSFDQIQSIVVGAPPFGMLFDYGDLTFKTSAGEYGFISLTKPNEFKAALLEQMGRKD